MSRTTTFHASRHRTWCWQASRFLMSLFVCFGTFSYTSFLIIAHQRELESRQLNELCMDVAAELSRQQPEPFASIDAVKQAAERHDIAPMLPDRQGPEIEHIAELLKKGTDAWGITLRLSAVDGEPGQLISAGSDHVFETTDDVLRTLH